MHAPKKFRTAVIFGHSSPCLNSAIIFRAKHHNRRLVEYKQYSELWRPILPSLYTNNITIMITEGFTLVGASVPEQSSWECNDMTTDRITVALQQENTHYSPCYDYLTRKNTSESDSDGISEVWRQKMCEWAYEVLDHFKIDREVVAIAMNYLDRTIGHEAKTKKRHIPRKWFQLVAVTSLFLATKLYCEVDPAEGKKKLRIDAFVELGRGMFSIKDLEETEQRIMSDLDWYLSPPTVISFVKSLLQLFPSSWEGQSLQESGISRDIFDTATYLTELSVCVSSISFHFKNSEIAYATILCAMDALRDTTVPIPRGARIAFFDRVAQVTSLRPSTDNIIRVCTEIRKMVPHLFTLQETTTSPKKRKLVPSPQFESPEPLCFSRSSSTSSDGSASPVCVSETPNDVSSIEVRDSKRPRMA